jgi:hypothetical protein
MFGGSSYVDRLMLSNNNMKNIAPLLVNASFGTFLKSNNDFETLLSSKVGRKNNEKQQRKKVGDQFQTFTET